MFNILICFILFLLTTKSYTFYEFYKNLIFCNNSISRCGSYVFTIKMARQRSQSLSKEGASPATVLCKIKFQDLTVLRLPCGYPWSNHRTIWEPSTDCLADTPGPTIEPSEHHPLTGNQRQTRPDHLHGIAIRNRFNSLWLLLLLLLLLLGGIMYYHCKIVVPKVASCIIVVL